ncbi:MAG: nucleotide pyrophosphohydrolase [Blautia sp.]|nr:nucleotide pyrophosphohydrolase [Blautia sp.]
MREEERKAIEELVEVVRALRSKCPWDSVQTMESLKERLACETAEVLEAIDRTEEDHGENLCEELGDVLMLLLLYGEIAEEQGLFTLEDVFRQNAWKMKFRHPKIFPPEDAELVNLSWEELKVREKELRNKCRKERNEFRRNP